MATISVTIKESDSVAFVLQMLNAMQEKGLIEWEGQTEEELFSLSGDSLEMEQLIKAIDEAEIAFEKGEGLTTDQLREKVRQWK